MAVIACDVSEWQPPVSNAYPHDWLIFRACDGTYIDKNAAKNLAWAKAAAKAGRIAGYTVYCVYRPNTPVVATLMRVIGAPDPHVTVMVDVESWSGAIRGNHSSAITLLATAVARWLGDERRVLVYGNQGDLASIYPNRPDWLQLIVAAYGNQQPHLPNMVGWQYTDGQAFRTLAAGLPRASKPFGACDHNLFPGLTATDLATALGVGEDMPLTDAEIQKIADRVWAKRFAMPGDPKTTYPASTWLVYGNLKAAGAQVAAQAAAAAAKVSVDTVAVAQDIKQRVIALLGGQS